MHKSRKAKNLNARQGDDWRSQQQLCRSLAGQSVHSPQLSTALVDCKFTLGSVTFCGRICDGLLDLGVELKGGPILGKIAAELLQFPVAHHHARKTCGNLATDGMFVHKLDRWKQVTSHPLAGNCCFNARTLIVLTVLDSTSKWTCRGCFRVLGSAVSSPLFHPLSLKWSA